MKFFLFFFLSFILSNLVSAQIPAGYYNTALGLEGAALKTALHNIIDNHQEYSYDDLRDFILEDTDEDPNNSNNIILLYTGRSQAKNTFGGDPDDWNREHVWAKSHGDFGDNPPCGTDAHHMRPTDASVNSDRGNLDFDNGGTQHSEATGCYYDADSWEPRNAVKGDVARMMFYMAVRYQGDDGEIDLELANYTPTSGPLFGKLSTLLAWNNQDPPDAFEQNRNEVIYGYQGNRNPFIDYPEFANCIWGTTCNVSTEDISGLKISFFPNPAKKHITIVSLSQLSRVTIYDITGKTIQSISLNEEEITLNIEHLNNGVYFVEIIDNSNKKTIERLIKQ
jgi:endonuclease I